MDDLVGSVGVLTVACQGAAGPGEVRLRIRGGTERFLARADVVTEVIKPAEAERVRVLALADAEKTRIQTEAAASNNRVALDQVLIEQLPSVVREAAQGLAKANITLLNGADGLSEVASGLVSQGLAIFETVRAGLNSARPDNEARAIGNASDGAARPSTQP